MGIPILELNSITVLTFAERSHNTTK